MDAVDIKTIPQGYKQSDLGLIPNDWDVKELGNIVIFKNGKAHENFINNDGSYIVVNSKFISSEGEVVKHSDKQLCPAEKDSILMVMSDVPSGKAIAKCFFVEKSGKYTINQRICSFYPKISPLFLYYKINRNPYFLAFDDGVKQTNLRKSEVLACEIAIPNSISEQDNISKVLSDIDSLIQKTEKLIVKKQAMKQGLMKDLLTGKKRIPGFSGVWTTKKLIDIAVYRRGSFPQPYGLEKWYDDNFGRPFVQVFDVDSNFKLKPITKRKISKTGENYSVFAKKGTIILTIQGSIGRICITQYDAFIDRTLLIFESFKADFDKYFLMLQLHLKFEIEKEKAPGGIIKTITKEALSDFEINYPKDKNEQSSIANVIFDMDSELNKLEKKLVKYNQIKQGAMQVLLTGKIRLNTNPHDNPITQSRAN